MDDTSRYPALSPLARQAGFLGVLPFVAALAGVLSGSTELRLLGERLALAVVLGGSRGTALLLVGFGFFWLHEHRRHGEELPPDYLQLRRVLSLTVCILLALITIGLGESS